MRDVNTPYLSESPVNFWIKTNRRSISRPGTDHVLGPNPKEGSACKPRARRGGCGRGLGAERENAHKSKQEKDSPATAPKFDSGKVVVP